MKVTEWCDLEAWNLIQRKRSDSLPIDRADIAEILEEAVAIGYAIAAEDSKNGQLIDVSSDIKPKNVILN